MSTNKIQNIKISKNNTPIMAKNIIVFNKSIFLIIVNVYRT